MIKTFDEFVKDYNKFYQMNVRVVRISTHEIEGVMYDLYDCEDYEVDYDEETIELF